MKDHLRQIVSVEPNPVLARCKAREYLQARILESLQDAGAFRAWAFQGGTALRFLYQMPRFSEDLDFALVRTAMADDFRPYLERIKSGFLAENYAVRIKLNDRKTVKSAFVTFAELAFELGFSPHRSETFSVKIELDTNPPAGAVLTSTLVRRHVTLNLQHHDRASLLAGKLHALLARPYLKGRDLYDLIWYLADRTWPSPNLTLLNNALTQTEWTGPVVTDANWRGLVAGKLAAIDWGRAVEDVRPFLERDRDVELLTRENALSLLKDPLQ